MPSLRYDPDNRFNRWYQPKPFWVRGLIFTLMFIVICSLVMGAAELAGRPVVWAGWGDLGFGVGCVIVAGFLTAGLDVLFRPR